MDRLIDVELVGRFGVRFLVLIWCSIVVGSLTMGCRVESLRVCRCCKGFRTMDVGDKSPPVVVAEELKGAHLPILSISCSIYRYIHMSSHRLGGFGRIKGFWRRNVAVSTGRHAV